MKYIRAIFMLSVIAMLISCGANTQNNIQNNQPIASATDENNEPFVETEPETKPETVYISSDGNGDYPTLEEAVAGITPDSTLVLEAGTYELSTTLIISRSLTLQGAGVNSTTISNSNGGLAVIAFEGEHLTLEGVALERTGEFAGEIIVAYAGEILLQNCSISGGAGSQDGSIKGVGFWLRNDAMATIENCSVENNMGIGIAVTGDATATINQVTCSNNQVGIAFFEQSSGEIKNSTCSKNQESGVFISGSAQVDVADNFIEDNGSIGILFQLDVDAGEVRNNSVIGNDQGGSGTDIQIWEEFSPSLINNTCDGSGQSVLGGDQNGIVFIARGSLPTDPILHNNSCQVARCSTPTGSLLSLECD